MNLSNPTVILALVAGILAVIGILKPSWPVVAVGLLLLALAVAVLIKA